MVCSLQSIERDNPAYMIVVQEEYVGFCFSRRHIMDAINITPNLVGDARKIFNTDVFHRHPEVKSWFDDPNGKHRTKFEDMSVESFEEYVRR